MNTQSQSQASEAKVYQTPYSVQSYLAEVDIDYGADLVSVTATLII